jgi:molybdate transport system substrate-binding protein
MFACVFGLFSLLVFTVQSASAETVRVAVASNFIKPMEAMVERFEQQTGHQVQVSFNSSGKHYAQIVHGAPFDLFLSADQEKPRLLEQQGFVLPGYRATYAIGQLVLWSKDSQLITQSPEILFGQDFHHLAIANPELAPYGQAAMQVLQKLNLVAATRSRWVVGKSISQTYQFVVSQNAELGFVAASQVMRSGKLDSGSGWIVPESMHQPIKQDVVLLIRAKGNHAAEQFYQFLLQQPTQQLIRSFGYR